MASAWKGTDPLPTEPGVAEATPQPAADWPTVPGYQIIRPLAPGGMGVVYRARHVGLNRVVALKMIRAGLHARPEELARFRVEAEAVASLSHPHIIQIYDCAEWNGMPYLAMEFAEGGSLAELLLKGPLPPLRAAELVETLARAVQFIHERGLIHRDLKPANVLLTDQDVPKLADFGLAKRLNQDQGLTRSQAVLGTASYMAPEQASGDRHALGPAADIYALGALLYEVLTGRPPFREETIELTIHKVLADEPLPPRQLRPELPPELEAICLKCLEKEPHRRFPSATALADDLGRYRRGEPTSTESTGVFEWHARLARRVGYEILNVLGTGVRGIVYQAQHAALKRTVALKMMRLPGGLEPARLAQLRAEAEAVAQLHHPHIVEVYDFGEYNGEPYIVREYVEGGSLADSLSGPPKPADEIAALVETLARAVHHAHERGLIHGRLKLSKVLLAPDRTAKVTGFGLPGTVATEPGKTAAMTRRDQTGTSDYLAPELVADPVEAISAATDVFHLGAMLYELLTGRPPGPAGGTGGPLEPARPDQPRPPRHWRPEVPRDLEAICLKCLENKPGDRYPSAAALAEDLRRFRAGEVLYIDDLDAWAQQERWARRAGYEILEVLRHTSEGFSYKARQVVFDRVVLLKRLSARYRFVPAAKDRFRREAHLLARLRHPHIVQFYDQGEQNDLPYYVREFVDGPSLAEVTASGPLPVGSAAELTEILAGAVHTVHMAGAVHGGLRPGVIRLSATGEPKLTSVRRAWPLPTHSDDPHAEAEACRRASYLAPEQLERGFRQVTPAADVYALGAILFTLLTGQFPLVAPTLPQTLELVRRQAPAPARSWRPDVPSDLEAICLACLDKQPGRRPASAEEVAAALHPFVP